MNCPGVQSPLSPVMASVAPLTQPCASPLPTPGDAVPAPTDACTLSGVTPSESAPSVHAGANALAATVTSTGLTAAAASIGGAIGRGLSALASGARFAYYGSIFRAEEGLTALREKIFKPLENLPVPTITIPFVLVPGWTTRPEAFTPLTDFLTRDGANGGKTVYVKQGAFFEMDPDGQLQPAPRLPANARVFEMVFSDTHQSPGHNLGEMRQNFDAITRATGAPQVDVEGFSMGGIDSRLYVDQGGKAIHRLLTLGTPHRGTEFANMVHTLFEKDVQWAMKFGGITERDRESMEWLRTEDVSPQLGDLNSRWDSQRKAVPTLSLGSDLMPTASHHTWLGLASGDGMVESSSLELPNSDTIVLHQGMQHGRLNDDEVVQHVRSVYFGWELPANAASFFPEDADIIAQVPRPPTPSTPAAP